MRSFAFCDMHTNTKIGQCCLAQSLEGCVGCFFLKSNVPNRLQSLWSLRNACVSPQSQRMIHAIGVVYPRHTSRTSSSAKYTLAVGPTGLLRLASVSNTMSS